MTGQELLDWLQEIPSEQLEKSVVVLDTEHDCNPLITAKFYGAGKKDDHASIFLLYR